MDEERKRINQMMDELNERISIMIKNSLRDIDNLDLGNEYSERLHRQINEMLEAQLPDFDGLLPKYILESHVRAAIKQAQVAGELPEFDIPDIPMVVPRLEIHGDLSFPAMRLTKLAEREPLDIANTISEKIKNMEFETPLIKETVTVPPGFNNFFLNKDHLKDVFDLNRNRCIEKIIHPSFDAFQLDVGKGKKAQVEFVSANPSGPITIGHARGAVVGDTMARLLEAAGYEVQREYYYNNAGNQMIILGKSLMLRYLQQLGEDIDFRADYYQGEYLSEIAAELVREHGDTLKEAGWEKFKQIAEARMFQWINRSLASIDIKHDRFYNETSLFESERIWQVLEEMRNSGHIYQATHWEGADDEEIADVTSKGYAPATWFRSTTFGDEKDRVMVKSDGAPTYTLPDIAYHCDKLERGFDIAVNVLGADHFSQAQVVKHGLKALKMDPDPIHVIFIQMVRAVRRKRDSGEYEAVKQSKRAGNFDTLDELVEMTSADAVRYHMLARNPNSQLDFDVEQVVKQSIDNPVYYIQNAHVRCAGILRNAEERGLDDHNADLSLLGNDEKYFIDIAIHDILNAIEESVSTYQPQGIAFCAEDLADIFHPIYDRVRVLHTDVPEEEAKARLRFYRAAKEIFRYLLHLMGMSAPERM